MVMGLFSGWPVASQAGPLGERFDSAQWIRRRFHPNWRFPPVMPRSLLPWAWQYWRAAHGALFALPGSLVLQMIVNFGAAIEP